MVYKNVLFIKILINVYNVKLIIILLIINVFKYKIKYKIVIYIMMNRIVNNVKIFII